MATQTGQTDYSHIVVDDDLILHRDPQESDWAVRYWQQLMLVIKDGKPHLEVRSFWGGDTISTDEWNRVVLTYVIASSEDGLRMVDTALLERDLAAAGPMAVLIDHIIAGQSFCWRNGNWIGCLDKDAKDAEHSLQSLIEKRLSYRAEAGVWGAKDFIFSCGGSDEVVLRTIGIELPEEDDEDADAWVIDDAMLMAAVRFVKQDARGAGVILVGDVEEAVRELIGQVRSC
jgi:hypothetical protein